MIGAGVSLVTSVLLFQAVAPLPPAAPVPASTLTLQRATETALREQPNQRIAQAQADAADARADEARSPLLPQVNASANYQRATSNFVPRPTQFGGNAPPAPASFASSDFWNFGVTASQLIYDFGSTRGKWRSAQANAEASEFTQQGIRLQTVLNVRTAFFQARSQKALVGVARETLTNQQRHLAQIQGFVELGTRPQIDLAQARTDVANAKVQLITSDNNYATAKAQLNQAMGSIQSTDYDVADDSLPPVIDEDLGIDTLVQSAVANRPELRSLSKQIEAQERILSAAKGNYGPALVASTGLTEAGRQLDQMVWNWNAQVTLSWSLFEGMLVPAQVREAGANVVAAKSQRDLGSQQIRLEVEQARLAVRAAKASLVAVEEALVNAREQLRLAEGRYQTGAGSVIELTDAQTSAASAAAQRVAADYSLASARASLLKALGRE